LVEEGKREDMVYEIMYHEGSREKTGMGYRRGKKSGGRSPTSFRGPAIGAPRQNFWVGQIYGSCNRLDHFRQKTICK